MKKTRFILALAALSLLMITSCKKDEEPKKIENTDNVLTQKTETVKIGKDSHTWYYFTKDDFKKIDKPENAPETVLKPWTETIRVSSANTTFNPSNQGTKAFAVVNRLGLLCFEGNNITLAKDENIFNDRTAGNLVFFNNTPIYSVYKSSFFNDTITEKDYVNDKTSHLFLIQFDDIAKLSYPIINSSSLISEPNSEIIDYVWDGDNWFCTIKTLEDKKNRFSYIKWQPNIPLLSMSPAKAKDNISVTESNIEEFKKAKEQLDYEKAPERIKNLLKGFSSTLPFTLELKTAGGNTPRLYKNDVQGSDEKYLHGKGILSQSWSSVLFEDGTLFLEGALPGKHILRKGKPIAIRLPKLPAGFIYSEFTISNNTLYASWEESSFYQTARSGFIQVDLNKTLYEKML